MKLRARLPVVLYQYPAVKFVISFVSQVLGALSVFPHDITFIFDVMPNTKGCYIENFNIIGTYCEEDEVLLQKNTHIKIKSAEYDKEKELWYLHASLSN